MNLSRRPLWPLRASAQTLATLCAALASLPALASPEHTQLGTAQGDFGGIGLMQTPSARMAPLGEFALSANRTAPYRRYNLAFQPTSWFEFVFRYVEVEDRLYGEAIAGDRRLLDKGMDAKLRLWPESRYLPALAVGVRDAGGTSLFGAEYLVASKRWYDLDFSLGVGWGALGTRGDFDTPLSLISERYNQRPNRAGGDSGGEFALNQLFRGPVALFAGVEYQTPWQPLSLQLEYEGNDYSLEPAGEPITQDSPFNLGAHYRVNDAIALRLGWQRGNTAMLGLSLRTNLAGLAQVKRDTPPLPLQAPADEATAPDWEATRQTLASQAGLRVHRLIDDGDTLVVEGEPRRFRSLARTAGRANRVLYNQTGTEYTHYRYRWRQRGLTLREDTHPRDDFVAAAEHTELASRYRHGVYASGGEAGQGEELYRATPPAMRYALAPGINQNFGGPDGYLYQLQLRANAEYHTDTNGWFSGTLGWTLADNLDKFEYTASSDLPRVRTFIGDYLAEASFGLTNLQYTRTAQLGSDWYAMGYGGLLEMMFAGVGGELLYRPFNSPFAIGADLNYVRQRDFDQRFELRDYSTWTGHLSAYVETGVEDVLAKVSLGRYLAGDLGATFDLSREFASGARLGAWATFTDAGDDFGEGSFDKGIYVSLPLDAFFTVSSRERVHLNWQPLTRDGGARLDRRYQLYDLTADRGLNRFWDELDEAWD